MQLAFHLAEKYRGPVIVLSDAAVGQTAEPVEMRSLPLEPLQLRQFALSGKDKKGGRRSVHVAGFLNYANVVDFHLKMKEKLERARAAEVRYETFRADGCDLLIVAYGSTARFCKGAADLARAQGRHTGVFRPISLWPFPDQQLRQLAQKAGEVLVVEDSPGELVEDVQNAVRHQVPVSLLGIWGRHNPGPSGIIFPERILEEVERIYEN